MIKDFLQILSSGSIILLTITLELRMVLQNISRRVVGDVLTDISPSNIFLTFMPFPAGFYQNYQAVLASVSINGFKWYNILKIFLMILPAVQLGTNFVKFNYTASFRKFANNYQTVLMRRCLVSTYPTCQADPKRLANPLLGPMIVSSSFNYSTGI